MIDNKILPLLKKIYPLSSLNDKDCQTLLNFAKTIRIAKHQEILQTGNLWPGLYFVLEGQILFLVEMSGQLMPYNRIRALQHFGSLISENVNNFSVCGATHSSTLLFLPKRSFQAFLKTHKTLEKVINEHQTQQSLKDFIIRTPMFAYVPTKHLDRLVGSLTTKKLCPNEILIRQGDDANEAYIIETGQLIVHIDKNPLQILSTLIPGDLVGEIALIKNIKRTTNVIAQTEVTVFVLPRDEFLTLFKEQNVLNEWLNELIQARLETIVPDSTDESHPLNYKMWLKNRLGLFPAIKQKKPQDSGAACIAMVCRYYGKQVNFEWIRLKITENSLEINQDATLSDLSQMTEQMGLLPLAVLSSITHLKTSALPAIVGWKGEHWVVVYQITDDKVSIVDPARGSAEKISQKIFLENWISSTLYLKPTEHFFGRLR